MQPIKPTPLNWSSRDKLCSVNYLENCSNISFYLLPPIGESWIQTWLPVGVISWVKTCEHKWFIKLSYIFTAKMCFFLFQTHAHYWSVLRQKMKSFFFFFKVCIIFIVYHFGCGLNKLDFSFWHKSKNNLVIQGTTKYLWWRMFCFSDDIFLFSGKKAGDPSPKPKNLTKDNKTESTTQRSTQ